ncbi:MAG: outer membrane lipid asymmetry maintenance protein MlaD [Alphaproteobacteria bacterium]|nr:outer membrane lipid asymmetry maintenance protein MlaD [Alphaproteobacteria bacterium]
MTRAGVFETIVGFIVIAAAVLFFAYAYGVSGKDFGADKYRIDAVFGRVDGITVGSEVRIAGVRVGKVTNHDIDLATYEVNLGMTIDRNIPIPEDSIAKISSDGVLGGAYVAIEPGASEEMLLEGDKIVITRGSVDLLNLAVQAFTSQTSNNKSGNKDNSEPDPLGDM